MTNELLNPEEQRLLLALAREGLRRCVVGEPPPEVRGCGLPASLCEPRGCFVTLTCRGALHGCIGNLEPKWPLWRAVLENTRAAATRDLRFEPLRPHELDEVDIEISVLSELQPLTFASPDQLLELLNPGVDGVFLQIGNRSATFLPQVWQKVPQKAEFLNRLAMKAGCRPDDWRSPGVKVMTYRAQHFSETDFA